MPFFLFGKKEKRAEAAAGESGAVSFEDSLLHALLGGTANIGKKAAMSIPTLQACINLIAGTVSLLPIKLYEEENGEVTEITDDPRIRLLNGDTGDTVNATDLRKLWVMDYFLGKGAYTYIERDLYGMPSGIYYVDESRVSPIPNNRAIYKDYSLTVDGASYCRSDFLKILRNSKGDGRGVSVIEESNIVLQVVYNTMKFENSAVKKGGNKKGFLTSDKRQSEEAMVKIKKAWAKMFSNSQDTEDNVVVLNEGMDFKESSATALEMQLNENKKSNAAEICKLFCIPPEVLSGDASESAWDSFISECITPFVNTAEAALDSDMLLEREKGRRYYAFDMRELTRGKQLQRYQAYAVALKNNFLQIDEVREMEDLKPTGFNYIRLGLQDVLLDPKTNKVYTPNTNALTDLNSAQAGFSAEDGLTDDKNGGIIEDRGNKYHDNKGLFTFAPVRMSKRERKFVSSAIHSDHPRLKAGNAIHPYEYGDYFYLFKVIEPGTYNFGYRRKITAKSQADIKRIRRFFDE